MNPNRNTPGEVRPPRWAERLLAALVRRPVVRDDVLASLARELREIAEAKGRGAARRWYARQALGIAARAAIGRIGRGHGDRAHAGLEREREIALFEVVRHAARSAWRRRTVSLAVIGAVALGIGAATSVASVIDALLLRPLPYPEPERMVRLNGTLASGALHGMANPYDVADWREAASFTAMSAYTTYETTVELESGPVRIGVAQVSEGMDRVLGIRAEVGRLFEARDYQEGARAAVLSHAFWTERLGADPSVVGRSLRFGGADLTVVGVLPPTPLPIPEGRSVWFTLRLPTDEGGARRSGVWLRVLGRLGPDVPLERAQSEMSTLVARLRELYPTTNAGREIEVVPLRDAVVGSARPVVVLMAASVGLVLLIACANIGNLLLAAAQERRRELAIRAALGSGLGRIARLILTESALLAGIGAALGLVLAPLGVTALLALYPGGLPRAGEVGVNGTVLVGALLATVLATLAAGLPPLLEARRLDLQRSLRAGERGMGGRADRRTRSLLVTAQVALSVALLVGGGLLVRTFAALSDVEPGFEAEGLLTFNVALAGSRYRDGAGESAFHQALLERIAGMPGVTRAGTSSLLPLSPGDFLDGFTREGHSDALPDLPTARLQIVSPGFLEALGIPLLAGRGFAWSDGGDAPRVVVVNEAFQRRWFPDGALGRRIRFQGEWRDIVGVVADKRHRDLRDAPSSDLWVPRAQSENPRLFAWVAVRAAGDPMALVPPIREALRELDPSIALADARLMRERIDGTLAPERFRAWLVGALAALATVLAMLGIYGLLAYSVAREAREIGIRIALGRSPGGVVRTTVLRAMRSTAAGIAIGLGLALAGGRFLAAFVPEVGTRDPLTLVAVTAVFLAVAALAALGPARRASRVDPAVTLRAD